MKEFYIGLMTGTSLDGVDISICSFSKTKSRLIKFYSYPFMKNFSQRLDNICELNKISKDEVGVMNKEIGNEYSKRITQSLKKANLSKKNIKSICISGQTIHHNVNLKFPFSMQVGDPNIIKSHTGIPVVSDLRNSHIAYGGQGAPLVPEFHKHLFHKKNTQQLILNIGGISNFSFLSGGKFFYGTDCGPGNLLLNAYCKKHLNIEYDKDGKIASSGICCQKSLNLMLDNKFFRKKYPKSTGRDLFSYSYIPKNLLRKKPEDVLRTLTEFTAMCILKSIKSNNHLNVARIISCGGGSRNKFLMSRISNLTKISLESSDLIGYPSQAIESMAFAWYGYKKIKGLPSLIHQKKSSFTKAVLGSLT